jgi:Tol biopolymer transport system component
LFEVRTYDSTGQNLDKQTLVGVSPDTRSQRTFFTSEQSRGGYPAWLPDQSSYVYTSNSPGNWSLVRALTAAPNAAVSVIASGEVAPSASWPSVAPDGKKVTFTADVRGQESVLVVDLDGSHLTILGEGQSPAWSPDGNSLAFSRRVGDVHHLFLVDPQTGTGLVQLTQGNFSHYEPSWSPDGRFIVFSTDRGSENASTRVRNMFIVNRDGTGLTQLTQGNSYNISPDWGRDNWIYFASDQSGNLDIWRLRPGGEYGNLGGPGAAAPTPSNSTAPPTATPNTGGCNKDTDCKGNRICEASRCVSP